MPRATSATSLVTSSTTEAKLQVPFGYCLIYRCFVAREVSYVRFSPY